MRYTVHNLAYKEELKYYDEGYQRDYVGKKYLRPYEAAVPALVAAWAGEEQIAKEYMQWARGTLRPDRDSVDPHPEEVQRLEQYLALVSNPEQLRQNVREEAAKFELQFAPYQDIVGVPYQEGQLFKDLQ